MLAGMATIVVPAPTVRPVGPLRAAPVRRGPNWFACVMGTGIVAITTATVPVHVPGQRPIALAIWLLAVVVLIAVSGSYGAGVVRARRQGAGGYASDPVLAPFFGAPPMALLTVGGGALVIGRDLVGIDAALWLDAVLWTAGTVTGLASAVAVPYLLITRHEVGPGDAYATWLMPVVPPMVSAATGALLVPWLPAGQARLSLLFVCYAMFGMSLLASLLVLSVVWARLSYHRLGPAAMVPTVWIVLGPLGQSITAVNQLATVAPGTVSGRYASGADVFAVLYGVPVWGFAALWLALAAALTWRTVRAGLPFAMTWWSFTFPVGTVVSGTFALAARTGAVALRYAGVALYAGLLVAWLIVATRTAVEVYRSRG